MMISNSTHQTHNEREFERLRDDFTIFESSVITYVVVVGQAKV